MELIVTSRFSDQYRLGEHLGKGTYSIVKKCIHIATKQEYAAKIINTKDLTERDWRKLENEARICQKLNHPNLIHLFDSITEADYHYFVFDLVVGGELFDEIAEKEYFSERDASRCIKQIFKGVEYCHNNSIVHRDLKPENLLLAFKNVNSNLKIADFGLAIEVNGDEMDLYGFAGTPIYLAPEVIKNEPYGKPVDMWACGVVLYILLVGDLPFWNKDKNDLFFLIKTAALNDTCKEWKSISNNAKDLILKLLNVDPERRLTATQALNHHWIQNCENYASEDNRVKSVNGLKQFNARRKLKGVIFTTMIANKFIQVNKKSTR